MHVEIYLLCMDGWHVTAPLDLFTRVCVFPSFCLKKTHIRPCLKMYCRSASYRYRYLT